MDDIAQRVWLTAKESVDKEVNLKIQRAKKNHREKDVRKFSKDNYKVTQLMTQMDLQFSQKGYNLGQLDGYICMKPAPVALRVFELELENPKAPTSYKELIKIGDQTRAYAAGYAVTINEHCFGVRLSPKPDGRGDTFCDGLTTTTGTLC